MNEVNFYFTPPCNVSWEMPTQKNKMRGKFLSVNEKKEHHFLEIRIMKTPHMLMIAKGILV
jgi:hypothetical protein